MRASRPLKSLAGGVAAAAVLATTAPAFAHVSITSYGSTFTAGATNVIAFRVPHGCPDDLVTYGANARTSRVQVSIPAAATGVKPEQKPGWDVTVVRDATTKAVTQITWTARVKEDSLADWTFADFGVRATLNGVAGDVLVFPTTQFCDYHDDLTAAALEEVWAGADAPKLTLVGSDKKVANPNDLAAIAGRVGAAEASLAAQDARIVAHDARIVALETAVAALKTAMAKAVNGLGTLGRALADLKATARLGFVAVGTQPTGRATVMVDLPSTLRFRTAEVKVGGDEVVSVQLDAAGDAATTLTIAQAAGVAKGEAVEVHIGAKLVAKGAVR